MENLDMSRGAPPLYLQISQILKNKIVNKEYEYGEYIPSEAELQSIYDVSRITARQAIQELEREGMVVRSRGKGTKVTYLKKIEEYMTTIKSFTDEMKERNIQVATRFAHISIVAADKLVAEIFHMEPGEPIYYLERVRTGDEVPIVAFRTYLSSKLDLSLDDSVYEGSLYEILAEKDCEPVIVEEKFDCLMPEEQIAKALETDVKQPVLRRTRVSQNAEGDTVEYTIGYYRNDRYSFHIKLQR